MNRTTGSKLPLAMLCPASMALPWIDEPPGPPAIRGIDIHAFLQACADVGREIALERSPSELRPFLELIDLESLTIELVPEAAFALDWRNRTARYLGSGLGRVYPERESETEIFLTTDVFGVSTDAVLVEDYKTGRTRYGAPDKFPQLLGGALAATLAYGKESAHVGLLYIDEHGEIHPSRAVVDGWDLEAFAHDLERAMDQVGEATRLVGVGATPDVRPGSHCVDMYCPAYRACPAKSGLVRHLPEHIAETMAPGYMAPERLARTWVRLTELETAISKMKEEIRALSFREPIELGDGWVLGPRERKTEELDAKVARDVLASIFGPRYADEAVTLEVTKAAVERAAKSWVNVNPKDADGKRVAVSTSKGTGMLDRVLAEIRGRGGSTTKTATIPMVYKRKALP